jgi:hypothetical protein
VLKAINQGGSGHHQKAERAGPETARIRHQRQLHMREARPKKHFYAFLGNRMAEPIALWSFRALTPNKEI